MYDYILMHMMLLPQNFMEEELLRAKFYLQELVPNPTMNELNSKTSDSELDTLQHPQQPGGPEGVYLQNS